MAEPGEIVDDGATFWLHIDNQVCTAVIDPPAIGAVAVADDCGFLRYPAGTDPLVTVAYHAQHPLGRATFGFSVYRGAHHLPTASASGEVTAATAGPYTGDGSGNFSHPFARTQLTSEDCDEAAFSENLHVYAKVTNGLGRLGPICPHPHDAGAVRAFALDEEEPPPGP